MERSEAVTRLDQLKGVDLVPLAHKYGVTIWKGEKINKGWAGHVLERYLGLPLNSSQSPNFGSWELKIVPLKELKSKEIVLKETMAVTMIDPVNVLQHPFENSHLLAKLKKAVICARLFESREERSSRLLRVAMFDLSNQDLYEQVRRDYEEVREVIKNRGFGDLSGRMGQYIQPRTKGPGHGSESRAFYARKIFVKLALGM